MKLSFLRRPMLALSLGLAATLAACGGKAEFPVQGTISGLAYPGLVLQNNLANDLSIPASATSFSFPGSIEYATPYSVTIKTPPQHQNCAIGNNIDTAGRQASIAVQIECSLNVVSLGGYVAGLTADGLVLINGSNDQVEVAKGVGTYVFGRTLPFGTSYGVTILKQPAGLSCYLQNSTGLAGDANIINVNLTCAPV